MERITERAQLVELARRLGVRPDWHEPDEQEITARVEGDGFDNAMGPGQWYGRDHDHAELHAILSRTVIEDGVSRRAEDIAVVNLATLFAWATGYDDHDTDERDFLKRLTNVQEKQIARLRAALREAVSIASRQHTKLCKLAADLGVETGG